MPSYNKNDMEMLKINGLEDFNSLKLTKWNIKQPDINDVRENAIQTGKVKYIRKTTSVFESTMSNILQYRK